MSIIVMLSIFTILVAQVISASVAPFDSFFDPHWENFKKVYGKQYKGSEENTRRAIWENHVAKIVEHNLEYDLGMHTFRKGLNEYADLSREEFVKTLNGYKGVNHISNGSSYVPFSNVLLPEKVDWRHQGLVTGIKNQALCGSCWAFSTTGSLEGQHKKKTGNLVSLSEQNLVDCSRPQGNTGCTGGWIDRAFRYVKQNGGIDTEQSYPYTAQDGTCHYKASASGATVTGYVDITSGNEIALQQAVATIGPVSVAIHGMQQSFQLYKGGIYNEPNCSSFLLDHAVLIIGYGTEDGIDYWLVKNSWGTTWGEKGYIKMSRNKKNQCGIATRASYPLV